MEHERARLERVRVFSRSAWKVRSELSSDAVKYKKNELNSEEKAAFERWRERRKKYMKDAYRERTEVNRRYANGEISLEEKQALEKSGPFLVDQEAFLLLQQSFLVSDQCLQSTEPPPNFRSEQLVRPLGLTAGEFADSRTSRVGPRSSSWKTEQGKGQERAFIGKYGYEAYANIDKAVDAVMNKGMTEAEARKLLDSQ
ncbi:hypothetical protein RvY_10857 [Ramazzottius varieornatus]|uniref:Uncharacterized protein n=1 Tax=Ramazzottius varieornatus TaxID=947166 RepID=A0A1D1VIK1_RAMVA|nr:hypothetical protein RvY_10857 [Ramazzottius varieornatus]